MCLKTDLKSFIFEFERGSLNICLKNSIILNLMYYLAELQQNEIEFNSIILHYLLSAML